MASVVARFLPADAVTLTLYLRPVLPNKGCKRRVGPATPSQHSIAQPSFCPEAAAIGPSYLCVRLLGRHALDAAGPRFRVVGLDEGGTWRSRPRGELSGGITWRIDFAACCS